MDVEKIRVFVAAFAVIVAQVAAWLGFAVDVDLISQIILVCVAFAFMVWAIWHNFNFTEAAKIAQELLEDIKKEDREIIRNEEVKH